MKQDTHSGNRHGEEEEETVEIKNRVEEKGKKYAKWKGEGKTMRKKRGRNRGEKWRKREEKCGRNGREEGQSE